MDNVIKLISFTLEKDKYGVDRKNYSYKEVFCEVHSITRAEFFNAGRNGLNPSLEVTMFHGDYHGETMVELEGQTYAVYRVFKSDTSDYIELYLERQGGTNGKEDQELCGASTSDCGNP